MTWFDQSPSRPLGHEIVVAIAQAPPHNLLDAVGNVSGMGASCEAYEAARLGGGRGRMFP